MRPGTVASTTCVYPVCLELASGCRKRRCGGVLPAPSTVWASAPELPAAAANAPTVVKIERREIAWRIGNSNDGRLIEVTPFPVREYRSADRCPAEMRCRTASAASVTLLEHIAHDVCHDGRQVARQAVYFPFQTVEPLLQAIESVFKAI